MPKRDQNTRESDALMVDLYPLLLRPALHVKVWGGRKLQHLLHKDLPTDEPYGEAWELHDSALIANGPYQGRTLGEALADWGPALVGTNNDPADGFPLLAKWLDAADWLSIQVHPNDAQARQLEGDPRGKSEAWIVHHAEPGSRIVTGVQPGTTPQALAEAVRENRLEALVVYAEVQAGDVFYMPANTIHAIGPGLVMYEIQQASDVTYRLYDWGRMGLDGQPRPLHIDQACQVAKLDGVPALTHPAGDHVTLVDCSYFRTLRHTLRADDAPLSLETAERFHILTCTSGALSLHDASGAAHLTLTTGQTALVPAQWGAYQLQSEASAIVLRSFQPA